METNYKAPALFANPVAKAQDASGCPVTGACGYGTTDGCLLWEKGVFVEPPAWELPTLPESCAAASDSAGAFVDRVWTPDTASCRLACFTAWQAAQMLRSKRLLFVGDSVLRQLFMHFVAFLRNLDVVEQPFIFHHGALYKRTESADHLCVEESCLDYVSGGPKMLKDDALLRYVWSPKHVPGDVVTENADNDNIAYNFSDALAADVVVVGLLYHLPHTDTLAAHVNALHAIAATTRVLWLTTPGEEYAQRNAAMRAWVTTEHNASVLALDSLAATGAYTSVDGKHFACNVDAHKDGKHQQACKDPQDTVNGNLVQMVLAHLAATGWGAS